MTDVSIDVSKLITISSFETSLSNAESILFHTSAKLTKRENGFSMTSIVVLAVSIY